MTNRSNLQVKTFIQPNGVKEYHFSGIESWDDFDHLVEFICRKFSATILDKLDGICSRTWRLQVEELVFTIKHHDDIGNYFFAEESSWSSKKLMQEIADAFNAQFES